MLFINISIKSNVVQILMKICIFPIRPDFRDIYTFSFTVVHFSHSYLFNIFSLQDLPVTVGKLKNLSNLNVDRNRLTEIPIEVSDGLKFVFPGQSFPQSNNP